jgi:hypothetical protein
MGVLLIDAARGTSKDADIVKSIQEPIIVDGHQAGSATLPAGATLTIISMSGEEVLVSRGGGTPFKVPRDTFSPESLAAALATPTPEPSQPPRASVAPSPTPVAITMQSPGSGSAATPSHDKEIADLKAQMDDAISKAEAIINQPVSPLQRADYMLVWTYHPGWFDKGALKPDFNTIDIRKTQKLDYQHQYVTSDLNPRVVYIGYNLEFNPFTKLFYRDLSVPKKKLTDMDMQEVNDIYRTIGKYEKQLADFGVTNYLSEKITNQPVILIH